MYGPSSAFLMNIFFALKGSELFILTLNYHEVHTVCSIVRGPTCPFYTWGTASDGLVVIFPYFLIILICFVVAKSDLVHVVEAIHDQC